MTVTIHNLGLMPNHPLNLSDGLLYLEDCKVVFKGVVRSERAVFEYIGDPMQGRFRAERKVSDGLFPSNDEANLTFNLEGILEEPMSWVNWEIEYAEKLGKRIVGVYAHGANECDIPEALEKYADDVRGWNSEGVIDAILGRTNEWRNPAGELRDPRPIKRYGC